MMTKRQIFFFGAVVGLLAIGGVYYYVVNHHLPNKRSIYFSQYQVAHKEHDLGNHDAAIKDFKIALATAPDGATAGHTQLKIAADYFFRNRPGDREEAYTIYKQLSADTKVPPIQRAGALNDMAFTMDLTSDHTLLETMVFNTLPYSDFMQESGGDMHAAVRRIYELSDSIYPNAFAKTQNAFMSLLPLLNKSSSYNEADKKIAQDAQKNLQDAKQLFNDPEYNYEKSKLAHMYLCFAMSWGISDRILHDVDYKDIETDYKQAIQVAHADSGNVYSKSTEIVASLFYSVSLNSRFGAARADDIKNLLKVFADTEAVNHASITPEYLKNVQKRDSSDFTKKQIISLGQKSPELKSYLKTIGWML